mgnify:CR=1 FL=1
MQGRGGFTCFADPRFRISVCGMAQINSSPWSNALSALKRLSSLSDDFGTHRQSSMSCLVLLTALWGTPVVSHQMQLTIQSAGAMATQRH